MIVSRQNSYFNFSCKSISLSLIVLLLAFSGTAAAGEYLWPTDASRLLSATFGEYRPGHFHAGIDIKTRFTTGFRVFAIDHGSITQIRVSPYGYGKAIYFRTESGHTCVFGHLSKFNEEIEQRVRARQKAEGRYSVRLFFRPGELVYEKGALLAFTGDTGTGFPHLHFELRDSLNHPVNPFSTGYFVSDNIPPVVRSVAVSPLTYGAKVAGDWKPAVLRLRRQQKGLYSIPDTVFCSGQFGLAVSAYDLSDGAPNKLAVYEHSLWIDGQRVFFARYDRFNYHESRQIEIQRDSRLRAQTGSEFEKLYRSSGNSLEFYSPDLPGLGILCADTQRPQNGPEDGRVYLSPGSHNFVILLRDYWGNQSQISGVLCLCDPLSFPAPVSMIEQDNFPENFSPDNMKSAELSYSFYDDYIRFELSGEDLYHPNPQLLVRHDGSSVDVLPLLLIEENKYACAYSLKGLNSSMLRAGFFSLMHEVPDVFLRFPLYFSPVSDSSVWTSEDRKFRIKNPPQAGYSSYWGSIRPEQTGERRYKTDVYRVFPDDIYLKSSVLLQFAGMDSADSSLGIYRINNDLMPSGYVGRQLHQGILSASVRKLGRFAVLADTIKPVIHNTFPRKDMTFHRPIRQLRVEFSDSLSGISGEDNYIFKLNGERLIVEFDPEENIGKHIFELPPEPGEYVFEVLIRDRARNTTRQHIPFTILNPNKRRKN